jgi:hypothetical protein
MPFDLSCSSFFFLGDDGNFQVAICHFSCWSCSISCHDRLEKRLISVSTVNWVTTSAHAIVTLVLHQDAWNTVLYSVLLLYVCFSGNTFESSKLMPPTSTPLGHAQIWLQAIGPVHRLEQRWPLKHQ